MAVSVETMQLTLSIAILQLSSDAIMQILRFCCNYVGDTFCYSYVGRSHISLPIGTNGKPLAAIRKFSIAIGKLMISKTLATNGEEITNAMISNDVLAIYW